MKSFFYSLLYGWIAFGLTACIVLVSCFSPDLSNVMFRCTEEDAQCQPGYICQAPWCVPVDSTAADMSLVSDLQSASDLAVAPDMLSGCAGGGGYRLGLAWACPGTYGPADKKPVTLCGPGYGHCLSSKHFTLQDLQDCRKLPGFYLAVVMGSYQSDVNLGICASITYPNKVIYGCGNQARAQDTSLRCSGFAQVFDCTYRTTQITCPSGAQIPNLDTVISKDPQDGILCCPA